MNSARQGQKRARNPIATSIVPITGISFQASGSGTPPTAKYGSQADFVMMPNAPWPKKQPATPMRRIHGSTRVIQASVELDATDASAGTARVLVGASGRLMAGSA